ncbi:MAG: iron-sulfur cluster assembly scaffold protein [Candidatus Buchananbacteria bacterium]
MAYSELVMQHFTNPHNQGQITDADAIGEVGNPLCGDMMKIYIKIAKSNTDDRLDDKISEVKFETLGCAAAIACSSILTDMALGKTLAEAFKIEKADIVKGLGELPPVKVHCSVLASDGLKVAIKQYLEKFGVLDQYEEIKKFNVQECIHE